MNNNDKYWNRCDVCGKFIPIKDFDNETAYRCFRMEPLTLCEYYETYCAKCNEREDVV